MYSLLIVDDEKKLREGIASLYDWNSLGFEVDACLENGKLAGDVDRASLENRDCWLTPVPGGVGPMTITMLLKNTLESAMR